MEPATGLPEWRATEFARLLALVEGERRYFQELFAQLPFAAAVFDGDGSLELANRVFLRRFPSPSPDLSRIKVVDLLPSAAAQLKARDVLSAGQPYFESGVGMLRLRRPDGNGHQLLVAFQDAVAKRVQSAPLNRRASDHLDAVFWEMDPVTFRFRSVSVRASEITGIRREDWRTPAEFSQNYVHAHDREAYLDFFGERLRTEEHPAVEYRVFPPYGSSRWLRDEVRPVFGPGGGLETYAGLTFDITERRQEERDRIEAGKRDAVERLSGRVSHVANNLLMIIGGYAEDLKAGFAADDPRREDLDAILAAGARLTNLTHQLALITKPPQVEAEDFDLREWMQDAIADLQSFLGPEVAVDVLLPEQALPVSGNRQLFLQVLTEAARLVRPAMPHEPRVMLVADKAPKGDIVQLSLQFGATDLPPEVHDRFFEPFAGPKEPGFDPPLGLAGVVRCLPRLGAVARLEGEPGEDPRLVLRMRRGTHVSQLTAAGGSSRYTVLLVDDESGIRSLMRKTLAHEDYHVLEAGVTSEALRLAEEFPGPIDVLITDMDLPEEGGRALAEQFRQLRPSTPILFITGHTDDPRIAAGELPPGSALLRKPFPLPALVEKVRAVLHGQSGAATAGH